MALLDCTINENVAVLMEDGAFALFLRPHPGGFDSSRVPTPGNLPAKAQKMLMGSARGWVGWAQLELTDALRLSFAGLTVAVKMMMRKLV